MDSTELAAYIGPGALAYRVLGPTADLLGDELRAWTERRLRNLGNIFSTLEHKYGSGGIEGLDEGAISPRVLRGILDEGSYIEDEVGTEYYGGVLAGSRTVDGRNDSAVALIEVMNTLSSPQLRAHFLIYAAAQQSLACSERFDPLAPYEAPDGGWRRVAVPRSAFEAAIAASGVAPSEDSISSVMRGLRRTELIHAVGGWLTAEPAELQTTEFNAKWPCAALVCTISNFGIELFCAAHGFTSIRDFNRPAADFRARFRAGVSVVEPIVMQDLPPAD